MNKKIFAVNAGSRKGWNTDTLISEASKGAEAAGAVVERFDLFRLEKKYRLYFLLWLQKREIQRALSPRGKVICFIGTGFCCKIKGKKK